MNIIDSAKIGEDGKVTFSLKWFHFSQNNSGGYFIKDYAVAEDVFIQDVSAALNILRKMIEEMSK